MFEQAKKISKTSCIAIGFLMRAIDIFIYLALVTAMPRVASAQPYTEGKTRHRFAQLTLGWDLRGYSGMGTETIRIGAGGEWERAALGGHTAARLIIGGTHFWGHADFYLGIPVAFRGRSGFGTDVEMGGRYYPRRIENGKLRPYVGAALLPVTYAQGEGTIQKRRVYPVLAGATFARGKHLFECGAGYNYNNRSTYYVAEDRTTTLRTQALWLSVGYRYRIETTLSAEKDWLSGRTAFLTDTLARLGRLDGLTLAIGPSAAFFLKESPHNTAAAPYAAGHALSGVFPELAVGYYLHRPDVQLGVAYRTVRSETAAFGYRQRVMRRALTLEAFKFIADYHGFAAFVGPALSYERLAVEESHSGGGESRADYGWRPGLTFGWDIRPNRLQSWYLRTNLRYFPHLQVDMSTGRPVRLDQLEFNFIQLVVFPGRMG